jgi:hypothetical protein
VYHLPPITYRWWELRMPSVEEVTQRAGIPRSLTGLTEAEFTALRSHFDQVFCNVYAGPHH